MPTSYYEDAYTIGLVSVPVTLSHDECLSVRASCHTWSCVKQLNKHIDKILLLLCAGQARSAMIRFQLIFSARQHMCLARYMLSSVRPSICLSVTRVYLRKTVEVKIMKFSSPGSPIPLVFAG